MEEETAQGYTSGASLVVQTVKNLPPTQETRVQSLDQKDPLEKGMATYSGILTWRIPWIEEPGAIQSMESQRVRQDCVTNTFTQTHIHTHVRAHTYTCTHAEMKSVLPLVKFPSLTLHPITGCHPWGSRDSVHYFCNFL